MYTYTYTRTSSCNMHVHAATCTVYVYMYMCIHVWSFQVHVQLIMWHTSQNCRVIPRWHASFQHETPKSWVWRLHIHVHVCITWGCTLALQRGTMYLISQGLSEASHRCIYSLVPRPHPPKEEKGLVNFGGFLGFIGGVVVTSLRSDWSMPPRGRFKLITQSCTSA